MQIDIRVPDGVSGNWVVETIKVKEREFSEVLSAGDIDKVMAVSSYNTDYANLPKLSQGFIGKFIKLYPKESPESALILCDSTGIPLLKPNNIARILKVDDTWKEFFVEAENEGHIIMDDFKEFSEKKYSAPERRSKN